MMQAKNWTVRWDDAMCVGIAEIDADHKYFVTLVNEFNESIEVRTSATEVRKRLQDILDDTVAHFANEERLLNEWGYPGADDHARVHAELLEMIERIKAEVSRGYDAEWVQAGLRIKEALIGHIRHDDVKFAEFFRKLPGIPDIKES